MSINHVDIKRESISNSGLISKNQALENNNENYQLNKKMKIIKHKKKKIIDLIKEKKNLKIIFKQKKKKKEKKKKMIQKVHAV